MVKQKRKVFKIECKDCKIDYLREVRLSLPLLSELHKNHYLTCDKKLIVEELFNTECDSLDINEWYLKEK